MGHMHKEQQDLTVLSHRVWNHNTHSHTYNFPIFLVTLPKPVT